MKQACLAFLIVAAICPALVWSQTSSVEITPPRPAADESHFGEKISRTMSDLATSTPENRKKVRVLFYGQSITNQSWSAAIARRLKKQYPNADLTIENRAIGGFTAERLMKTAEQDLYSYYPDLVFFHVYGGLKGEFETIVSNIRKRTTAEIILATHHVSHPGIEAAQAEHEQTSQMIRDLAVKYDCELVEAREEWKGYLMDNHLPMQDLLQDVVHLNLKGCALMEALVWRHFRYSPAFTTPHAEWIKTIPVEAARDGSIKTNFIGNRVDLIAGTSSQPLGSATIRIDEKSPSTNPLAYACTRPSLAYEVWWPALYTVGRKTMPVAENWILKFTEISENGRKFKYSVSGSKTGPDGSGDSSAMFTSNSGRVVIDPVDFGIASAWEYSSKPCPDGFEIHWSVVPLCLDTYRAGEAVVTTVVKGIENATHTLEIIPTGNGSVPIREIKIYTPPIK